MGKGTVAAGVRYCTGLPRDSSFGPPLGLGPTGLHRRSAGPSGSSGQPVGPEPLHFKKCRDARSGPEFPAGETRVIPMAGKFATSAPKGARASCLWVKVQILTTTDIPRKRGTTPSLKPPPASRSFEVWTFRGAHQPRGVPSTRGRAPRLRPSGAESGGNQGAAYLFQSALSMRVRLRAVAFTLMADSLFTRIGSSPKCVAFPFPPGRPAIAPPPKIAAPARIQGPPSPGASGPTPKESVPPPPTSPRSVVSSRPPP
jgi:hypothetical protein